MATTADIMHHFGSVSGARKSLVDFAQKNHSITKYLKDFIIKHSVAEYIGSLSDYGL